MSYEELIADEDYDEKDAIIMQKQNKIDNLNEKLEDYEWLINELREEIEKDMKINKRCFIEKADKYVERIIKLWNDYDKKLLEIMEKE